MNDRNTQVPATQQSAAAADAAAAQAQQQAQQQQQQTTENTCSDFKPAGVDEQPEDRTAPLSPRPFRRTQTNLTKNIEHPDRDLLQGHYDFASGLLYRSHDGISQHYHRWQYQHPSSPAFHFKIFQCSTAEQVCTQRPSVPSRHRGNRQTRHSSISPGGTAEWTNWD